MKTKLFRWALCGIFSWLVPLASSLLPHIISVIDLQYFMSVWFYQILYQHIGVLSLLFYMMWNIWILGNIIYNNRETRSFDMKPHSTYKRYMAQLTLCFYIIIMGVSQLDPVLNPLGYIISSVQPIFNAYISQEGIIFKILNYLKKVNYGFAENDDQNHVRIWMESTIKTV